MMSAAASSTALIARMREIVGRRHIFTQATKTASYTTGYRVGAGEVAAVVRPGSLLEMWQIFEVCMATDHIVIPQAANTGLTGGSAPFGEYDRPLVVINTLRLRGHYPIKEGTQVLCLAGSTLYDLEAVLAPLQREPHSVIGSSCIGATVVGGICNNSGGALVQRGPAYTEYALFASVNEDGGVRLHNHLGIHLGNSPEDMLRALDAGSFSDRDIDCDSRAASASSDYAQIVRAVDEPTPARFNSDPRRLFEAAGSAGKLLVFAVRVDTFPAPQRSSIFYIGTNDATELTALRRRLLADDQTLPVSGEYIHREAFDVAAEYGKDTVLAIRWLGTRRLPLFFDLKSKIDRWARASRLLPAKFADRLLQFFSRLFPPHLPNRILEFRDRYEHHLILKVADDAIDTSRSILSEMFPNASGDVFECNEAEADAALLHRFAVAGAAVRYRNIAPDEIEDVVAIDVALRRDDHEWFEQLPPDLANDVVAKLYYGHFFCHVFHQDYLLKKGVDPEAFEHRILKLLDARGAEYPAEHNVGHMYAAKPELADHYRTLDPGNRMNPGIGAMSRNRTYK